MKNMDFVYGFSNATVYDKAGMYVNITIVICIAIVILALIAAWTILRCRRNDAEMKLELESQKRKWEKEDIQTKIDAEIRKREWEKEDAQRKIEDEDRKRNWEIEDAQRTIETEDHKRKWEKEDRESHIKEEIRNKKMIFLEEYVKKDSELKNLTKEEVQDYLNMLDNLVKSQKTDQTTTNEA